MMIVTDQVCHVMLSAAKNLFVVAHQILGCAQHDM